MRPADLGGGYAAWVSSIARFSLDAAPLLDWASRQGDALDQRAAEAVVGLLALSGARRRTGLPEPAPELVKELMLLPAVPVLSQLTGIPGPAEEDHAELEPAASRLACVVDRLAGLGITIRAGDAIALTPLGSALLRNALILGTTELDEKAAASFPTRDEVLCWDARQLVGAVGNWPEAAARLVLRDWLAARGAAGWETLLPALSAPPSDDIALASIPAAPDRPRRRTGRGAAWCCVRRSHRGLRRACPAPARAPGR